LRFFLWVYYRPCEEIQNSLGFWIPRRGFLILGTGFRILCQWNLDSGFQALVGFRIPWTAFRIPKPRILGAAAKIFWIPELTSKTVPNSRFPYNYMGRILIRIFRPREEGSASDWSYRVGNLIQPIRTTTKIWVVTRHQYGISALVSQTSFGGETSGSVAKCRLFSQARIFVLLVALNLKLFRIYEELHIKKMTRKWLARSYVEQSLVLMVAYLRAG